jgi:hypothetical protein
MNVSCALIVLVTGTGFGLGEKLGLGRRECRILCPKLGSQTREETSVRCQFSYMIVTLMLVLANIGRWLVPSASGRSPISVRSDILYRA